MRAVRGASAIAWMRFPLPEQFAQQLRRGGEPVGRLEPLRNQACRITQQPLDQLREIVGRRLRAVAASPCALVRAAVEAGCGALALANVLVDHAIAELDTVGDHLINGAGVAGALRVLSRRTLLGVGCV